mmetsp:Transcript_19979/g.26979  ORF Transcript_19979/g.26979 Transcript_19979/m.26979 type:complete len:81 (+) Transcript_19979:1482-1724(+)
MDNLVVLLAEALKLGLVTCFHLGAHADARLGCLSDHFLELSNELFTLFELHSVLFLLSEYQLLQLYFIIFTLVLKPEIIL